MGTILLPSLARAEVNLANALQPWQTPQHAVLPEVAMRRSALLIVCSFLACSPTAVVAGGIPSKKLKELKAA